MWEKLAQILPGCLPQRPASKARSKIRSCPVPRSRPSAALWAVAGGQPLHGDMGTDPRSSAGAAVDTRPTFIGKKLRIQTGIHRRLDATTELVPQLCWGAVGDRGVAFLVGLLRHVAQVRCACRPPASHDPRADLAGSGAAPAPVDGFPREKRSLPCGRSRRRNTGRGAGRESPDRGSQGARKPFVRWGWGRAEVSPIARQRETRTVTRCAQPARARCP